ncbi:hypothetical protein COV81_01780 [Candidatus Peregrinibacteria bacterium CG11_big_fil_rev_8_21_14_0_20_41_10]|nr:MAG: hypothetical protein COV81_01780 [Candidatus Peregrinibacteria bacterium CG11_big_fil_rev_8_21_14_0_20_41_10]PIZ76633.1 MAG: hypothetical protein COY06_01625 [Candidatus Peregrinibacteria bacterium CG_4_10_14_0_2_um_filter_41_8]PJC37599.1 MAG: hypothetical protein CO045_04780 [Candidatus Peregrinibacteria bacterium CG_4_9_14_0_2_um_filter_41_14]
MVLGESGFLRKIYIYWKKKIAGYLPEQFGDFVERVELYLEDFFGMEKVKDFIVAARSEKRDVGNDFYTSAQLLNYLGIGADVKPQQVKSLLEKQIKKIQFLGHTVHVHIIFAKKLKLLEGRVKIAMKKYGYKVETIGGYDWRCVTSAKDQEGPKKLSYHGLGLAIDIDPEQNPYRSYGDDEPKGDIGRYKSIVRIFENAGISWGGRFKVSQNPMHFELKYEDILNLNA